MEEWKSGKLEEWKIGRVEEWKIGRMEEWKNGRMEEWKNGRNLNTEASLYLSGEHGKYGVGRLEFWKVEKLTMKECRLPTTTADCLLLLLLPTANCDCRLPSALCEKKKCLRYKFEFFDLNFLNPNLFTLQTKDKPTYFTFLNHHNSKICISQVAFSFF